MGIDFGLRANFVAELIGALFVSLVDDEYVGYFHNTGLHALYRIAQAGHQDETGRIGNADYVDLILPDANGFYHYYILTEGIEDLYHISRGFGHASEKSSRGHASNINIGIIGNSLIRTLSPSRAPPVKGLEGPRR